MRHIKDWILSHVLALAVLALLLSGIAVAAKKPSGAHITGCYGKTSGMLRVLKPGKQCKRSERKIVWTKSGTRGARGARGAQGERGTAGPSGMAGSVGTRGATGPSGPSGDTGPSNALEAFNSGPVTITGTDVASANSLATLTNVAPGNYVLTARVQLNGATTTAALVYCTASLGTRSVRGGSDIGTSSGNAVHAVVPVTFTVTLPSTGTANLKCNHESLTGTPPTASDAYLELLKVSSASSVAVSG